jgi:threonylcarbamoyladenosine tRNA methylthiotransferase MtaB
VLVEDFGRRPAFDAAPIEQFGGRSRAFVKIQEGCDLRCSYCLIWRARGPARSSPQAAVLDQVARLHEGAGFDELVLTGVHMGSWGRDLPGRPRLADLLAAVSDRFPALRLRLSSIHPDELGDDLLALLRDRPQLRPHLHVSLQSGSDGVLARMRRPYRVAQARAAVAAAVRQVPDCGLGADVIVGFPGETEAEFAATGDLVAELPFSYLHVFRYSPRPGTPAAGMTPVHPETVRERAARLREVAAGRRDRFARRLVGQEREAVLEDAEAGQPGCRHATTDNYAPVTVRTDRPAGTLVRLRLTAAETGHLQGELVTVLKEARP